MFSFCFKHEIKHFSLWFHSWDQFHRLRKKIFCKKTFFSLLFLNFSNCEDFVPLSFTQCKNSPKKKKSWKCFFHPVSLSEEKVFSWGEKKSLTHEKQKFRCFIVLPSVTHEIKDERLNEVFSRKIFFHLVTHVKIPSWKGNFQETTSVKNMFSDFFPSSINWVKKKLGKNKLLYFSFRRNLF